MYVYADGIHLDIRLEEDRLRVLVMLGVNEDGKRNSSPSKTGTEKVKKVGHLFYET